jgi:hypothetical protein
MAYAFSVGDVSIDSEMPVVISLISRFYHSN